MHRRLSGGFDVGASGGSEPEGLSVCFDPLEQAFAMFVSHDDGQPHPVAVLNGIGFYTIPHFTIFQPVPDPVRERNSRVDFPFVVRSEPRSMLAQSLRCLPRDALFSLLGYDVGRRLTVAFTVGIVPTRLILHLSNQLSSGLHVFAGVHRVVVSGLVATGGPRNGGWLSDTSTGLWLPSSSMT